jgi:hypothetical protein
MAKHTRNARQREPHGKGSMKHTAKKDHTAMIETSARQTIAMMLGIAVREAGTHGNDAFVICSDLCCAPHGIFVSILFHLILIFIFGLFYGTFYHSSRERYDLEQWSGLNTT